MSVAVAGPRTGPPSGSRWVDSFPAGDHAGTTKRLGVVLCGAFGVVKRHQFQGEPAQHLMRLALTISFSSAPRVHTPDEKLEGFRKRARRAVAAGT